MRRTSALLATGVAAMLLLTGCSGRADRLPGAVTDRACSFAPARWKDFATRPSLVRSTKAASCVLRYADWVNPTNGFTDSASITYSVVDDHEYGDAGGDGVSRTDASGRYDRYSDAAYELDSTYDETATLYGRGSDTATLRHLDLKTDAVYVDQPQTADGWARTTRAAGSGTSVLDRTHLIPLHGFAITRWTKASAKGRSTWTFALGDRIAGGTVTVVVAANGRLLRGTSSLHWDGQQHTTVTTFTGTYGRVPDVGIPPEVVAAAR